MQPLNRGLAGLAEASVLVAGDLMLDRYWYGVTHRISPEAPVPVVRVSRQDERPGGAANVALNVASLGARAVVIGVAGEDEEGRILEAKLREQGVACHILREAGLRTIVKLRVLSQHQQLIRLDFEAAQPRADTFRLGAEFRAALGQVNVVVLSDYAKGALAEVATLISAARGAGVPVVVDPKGTDFERYRGASVFKPNRQEFEAVVGPCRDEAELARKARELAARLDLGAVLVTRGEQGMTLVERGQEAVHLPARARDVYDVTGAGDTVCAVLAAGLGAGFELLHAAALANAAAGIVVGKLGAAAVRREELEGALHDPTVGRFGILTEGELLEEVRAARLRGERIVMTNGCFDLLHAGHVAYLKQARQLGDRLIVAVNDDRSVRRLKGPGRPITPLEQRMEVLAALAVVDWVVPFAEDTPQRLICRLLPDVLVKGGDYRPEEVAGADCVRAHGGKVAILGYRPGCSTSGIVRAAAHVRAGEQAR